MPHPPIGYREALNSLPWEVSSGRRGVAPAVIFGHLAVIVPFTKTSARFILYRVVIDGSVTELFPLPPKPYHVVKISCLPIENVRRIPMRNRAAALRHISISPCTFRKWPLGADETRRWTLSPGPDHFVDFLYESAQRDVESWARAADIPLTPRSSLSRSSGSDSARPPTPLSPASIVVQSA